MGPGAAWNGMKWALRFITGMLLILIGLVCMPVPVVPGLVLVFAGLAILGWHTPVMKWVEGQCKRWFGRWRKKPAAEKPCTTEDEKGKMGDTKRVEGTGPGGRDGEGTPES